MAVSPAFGSQMKPSSAMPPPVPLPDYVVVDGVNGPNEVKKRMNGALLVPSAAQNPITIPAASGSNPGTRTIFYQTPSTDSAEIFGLTAWPTGTDILASDLIYCFITTMPAGGGIPLMNRPIPYRHVFGNSYQPMMVGPSSAVNPVDNGWAAPIPLMRNSSMTVDFINPSTQTTIATTALVRDRNFRATDNPDPVSESEQVLIPLWIAPSNNLILTGTQFNLPAIVIPATGTSYVPFQNTFSIGMYVTAMMIDFYSDVQLATGNVDLIVSLTGNRQIQNQSFNTNTCMGSSWSTIPADVQQGFGSGRMLEFKYPIWLGPNDTITMQVGAGLGYSGGSSSICTITLLGVGTRAIRI